MAVGRYKLIADADGGNTKLFDLHSDPGEVLDIAPVRPDVVRDLKVRLLDELMNIAANAPAPSPGSTTELTDQEVEQLRELGYLQ